MDAPENESNIHLAAGQAGQSNLRSTMRNVDVAVLSYRLEPYSNIAANAPLLAG